eukprot:3050232-Rhodomonas_salina.1
MALRAQLTSNRVALRAQESFLSTCTPPRACSTSTARYPPTRCLAHDGTCLRALYAMSDPELDP